MNNKKVIYVIVIAILGFFSTSELFANTDTQSLEEQSQVVETSVSSTARSRLGNRSSRRKKDMKAIYKSRLKKKGINDYSVSSLTALLDDDCFDFKYNAIMLLGEMKEYSAISKLQNKLNDPIFSVRLAATRALLQMDNRKGVANLVKFSHIVSADVEDGKIKELGH